MQRIVFGIGALIALGLTSCTAPAAVSPTPVATGASASPSLATASPSPSLTPTPSPSPTAAPSAYISPRGTITVDQPRAFASVTSPMTVSGTASLFEGAFTWRLVDLAGKEIAKGSGQASPGAPARGTFSFNVTFTVSATTYAYVSVISISSKDGSVDDEARVPIVLGAR